MTRSLHCLAILAATVSIAAAENWPGWRGPRGDGTSLEKNVPLKCSASENIVWKTGIPGLGHASPIVWGDRVFTVTCVPETEERLLLCFDRKSGEILWRQTVVKSPLEKKHKLNSHASSTPVTDGKLIYVAFLDVQEMVVAGDTVFGLCGCDGGIVRWNGRVC